MYMCLMSTNGRRGQHLKSRRTLPFCRGPKTNSLVAVGSIVYPSGLVGYAVGPFKPCV